ncbi:MAG: VCBS repeat-containing protein, partial [Pirellulaceae bacterium]|nr:VCBS repeat-containing protein [Pirellulaceae bacterium]
GNVPLDTTIDCAQIISEHGSSGVLDPNSFEVINIATGQQVPFARSEDFAYSDRGQLEWVITDPMHTKFEVRFRSVTERPALKPQDHTPPIGVGDLLRYNAGEPRPIALPFPARLVDLTGDGKLDLVGCWNYAYRPGWPWDGIVCYPRVGDSEQFEFGDLTRLRYLSQSDATQANTTNYQHFINIYMWADFADFDGDGLVDIVWCPANSNSLRFYRNTGRRDEGGMPVFVEAGRVAKQGKMAQWESCRAVDLDNDGAMDVVIGDVWLRNTQAGSLPPQLAPEVALGVAGNEISGVMVPSVRCWFDVYMDGRLDAVVLEKVPGEGLSNFRTAWSRNTGGSPPKFAALLPLADLPAANIANTADAAHTASRPYQVTAVVEGNKRGLLVTTLPNLTAELYEQSGPGRFAKTRTAQSKSAVLSLGDQAWPNLCDWDADGDLDLLVGGGYGWPQIVINQGTRERPKYAEPQNILADGEPIRIIMSQVYPGCDQYRHNMGYPFPVFVDWDGNGLSDLMVPNCSNRQFWYRNIGTRREPRFGARQQLNPIGYEDTPEKLAQTGQILMTRWEGELEPGQPFFWRTGAAFADFNDDGFTDMITHDGEHRKATLFVQRRDTAGKLRLYKEGPLKLSDGRLIDDALVGRKRHWTESFRSTDWDNDGLLDLIYSCAGSDANGSIYLLRNVGTKKQPQFDAPRTLRCFGEPIFVTAHGPHPWVGDLDGDGKPDLVTCVEWSVYPYYSHHALEMPQRPSFTTTARLINNTLDQSDAKQ